MTETKNNPLGYAPIGKLMVQFAVPSIVAMLVGALYNIVDQLFIGHAVGTLGNAATNIAFPFTTSCLAFALLFGIGGASCFNLSLGRGDREKAPYYVGNAVTMLLLCGILLLLISQIFLEPLLLLFGSPSDVLPYAFPYVRITSIGFPFLLLGTGGGHLMRADGSPQMTMISNLTGGTISLCSFLLFQTMPRQLLALFGEGSDAYFEFGVKAFRVMLFFTWFNFMQPITSTFFTSIGKSIKGVFLSMTRQILFLLPLILILPHFWGIDGILVAGPIADCLAGICAVIMVILEFRKMTAQAQDRAV